MVKGRLASSTMLGFERTSLRGEHKIVQGRRMRGMKSACGLDSTRRHPILLQAPQYSPVYSTASNPGVPSVHGIPGVHGVPGVPRCTVHRVPDYLAECSLSGLYWMEHNWHPILLQGREYSAVSCRPTTCNCKVLCSLMRGFLNRFDHI